jgi:excisionase family DNA binding protein
MSTEDELLSTAEAAKMLGVTRQRVLELIGEDRIAARKVGRSYVLRANDVASLELLRVGRPPKTAKVLQIQKANKKGGKK